ncbi:hypothetical protein B0H21DRAFT_751090 [Amylocystis lapponica]|nr:hypothetical protein B0H21DRAFT_751090 [Amylocystis lapponica]
MNIRVWNMVTGEAYPSTSSSYCVINSSYIIGTKSSAITSTTSNQDTSTVQHMLVHPNNIEFDHSSILGDDGWMSGRNGELLFWVPPHAHRGLMWPHNSAIMGLQGVRLDMSHFFHGTSWQKCYDNNGHTQAMQT